MAILRASAALAAFLGIAQASVTLKPATNFDADFNEYLVKYNKYYSRYGDIYPSMPAGAQPEVAVI
jgi:hypothetical protein